MILLIFITLVSASDNETVNSCFGDNETIICSNSFDNETFFIGSVEGEIAVYEPPTGGGGGGGGYNPYNETKYCYLIKDFILNHTSSNKLRYNITDLEKLSYTITEASRSKVNISIAEDFLLKYNEKCKNITGEVSIKNPIKPLVIAPLESSINNYWVWWLILFSTLSIIILLGYYIKKKKWLFVLLSRGEEGKES